MAGAGTEVGRISIKVTPDTEDFRRQLKNQLTAIEKSLRGEVPVNLNVDSTKAKGQLAASLAGLKAAAATGVSVPVRTDSQGVDGALRSVRAGLLDMAKLAKQAGTGVRDYTREVKRLTLEQQKLSPLLNHDVAVLRSHGAMLKRGIASMRDFGDGISITRAKLENMGLDADAARWRAWQVAIRDSNKNAANGFANFKRAFQQIANLRADGFLQSDIFSRFGKDAEDAGNKVSSSGRKIFGLTRIGWLIAAGFAGAAPAIGLVAGLIAGLPSLMMTFGAAAGAIALGVEGIKNAAKTVAPQWEAMRAVVAQRFESGLTPMFAELAEKVFPVMETGMLAVTDGLLNMGKNITGVLTSAGGLKQLETIFSGIGGFFTSIGPSMGQFTQSFLQLGAAGAQSMGHLTGFISNFASQWQNMVTAVTSDGTFDAAMAGMSQALSGFTGLFTQLMQSGLGAMAKLGEPLQNMFSGLGNLISAAMPGLTSFASMIANVIGNLGNSLAPAFAALGPVVEAIRPTIESLATTLGGVLSQAVVALAPGLTAMANVLGPVLTTAAQALAPIIAQVASTLGGILLTAVQALAPIMPQLTQAFIQIAQAVGQGLAQLLPLVAQAFQQLLPIVLQLIPIMLQLVPAFLNLVPGLTQLAAAGLRLLSALMPLINLFVSFIGVLGSVVAKMAEVAAVVVSVAALIVSAFVDALAKAAQAISDFIGKAVDWFSQLPGKIQSALGDVGSILINAGKAIMDGLLNGIKAGWEAVKGFVGNIAGWIADLKGPLPYDKKVLVPNGEALMEGLNTGLEKGFDGTIESVKSMATAIFEAVKDVFGSANGLALNFNFGGGGGGLGMAGGLSGLSSTLDNASTSAKGFQSNITGALNPTKQMTIESKEQTKELSRQLAILEMRRKELEMARAGLGKGPELDAIKAELDQIKQQKLALGYQKDQLLYAQKYGTTVEDTNAKYDEQMKKLANMPVDFAKTTASTALNDFGISGGGALGALADYGMELGSKFIFNVNSVDEAMQAKDRETTVQSMGVVGR